MTDNWNYAFDAVTGEYVIYIGDDDGLTVNGIKNLRNAIKRYPIGSYKWNTTEYQWPIDDIKAKVISKPQRGRGYKVYNLTKFAKFVMANGGWLYYKLPGVYHAAVKKSILDQIKRKNGGTLFLTTQPDLFMAMAVPEFCKTFVKLPDEVTIQGRSAKSNGGSSISKVGKDTVSQYIKEYGDYKIDPALNGVPYEMSWFMEPFIVAQKIFDVYSNSPFNYSAMWAFATRIGFVDLRYIWHNYKLFPSHHNFSFFSFGLRHIIHLVIKLRREIIVKSRKLYYMQDEIPDNIYTFSRYLEKLTK